MVIQSKASKNNIYVNLCVIKIINEKMHPLLNANLKKNIYEFDTGAWCSCNTRNRIERQLTT